MTRAGVLGEVKEVRSGRGVIRGLLRMLREEALSIALFFGPWLVGWVGIGLLVLVGVIPGVVGWALMLTWVAVSFVLCCLSYLWIDDRKRRERIAKLALIEMPHLASRVIALYSRPAEGSRVEEVFALYQQAHQALESGKDPRYAGEMIERGILLADELLKGSDEGPSVGAAGLCTPPEDARGKAE